MNDNVIDGHNRSQQNEHIKIHGMKHIHFNIGEDKSTSDVAESRP